MAFPCSPLRAGGSAGISGPHGPTVGAGKNRNGNNGTSAAVEQNRNDPPCAAETLIRQFRPEGVTALKAELDSMELTTVFRW